MAETHTVHDPFLGKSVEVSDRLVDRLRGRYACGPHLPNGNPEFGWRQFEAPPIQHEAADEIERRGEELKEMGRKLVNLHVALQELLGAHRAVIRDTNSEPTFGDPEEVTKAERAMFENRVPADWEPSCATGTPHV